MNVICLLIWCAQLVYGFAQIVNDKPVNSIVYLCAVSVCILYYIDRIF